MVEAEEMTQVAKHEVPGTQVKRWVCVHEEAQTGGSLELAAQPV